MMPHDQDGAGGHEPGTLTASARPESPPPADGGGAHQRRYGRGMPNRRWPPGSLAWAAAYCENLTERYPGSRPVRPEGRTARP
jgi:hypothetical protein